MGCSVQSTIKAQASSRLTRIARLTPRTRADTYNSFRRQLQPIRDKLKMMSGDINSVHVKNATQSSIAQDSKQTTQPKTDSKLPAGFQFDPSCKADDFF